LKVCLDISFRVKIFFFVQLFEKNAIFGKVIIPI
jgi:hypothetical protein